MPIPEKAQIVQIQRLAKPAAGARTRWVLTGIGDDCAVLRTRRDTETLVTTDFSLEGIHFRREWHPPESIGHRCLARGLSDIAAMGGEPIAAFLSLALPRELPQSWVKQFLKGWMRLAEAHQVVLAGGDTAQSPGGVLADIIVVGAVPTGEAILRSGAQAGDGIYVSGELGGSAAAIAQMRANKKLSPRAAPRHFYPEPRVALGRTLRERHLASAMIDLSDGLSTDLAHICEESGVGAEIDTALIPCARLGKSAHYVDLEFALHGGEDYELLFTVPPEQKIPSRLAGVALTRIGRITRRGKVFLRGPHGSIEELAARGWEHFRC
jgi:thiamine-monophosphate kinase